MGSESEDWDLPPAEKLNVRSNMRMMVVMVRKAGPSRCLVGSSGIAQQELAGGQAALLAMDGFRRDPATGKATGDPVQQPLPIPWTLAATDECSDWERETHGKSWNLAMLKALRRWSHNGTGMRIGGHQPSGDGSSIWATTPVRKFLRYVFDYLKIRTFLDVPCGDMTWMPEVDLTGVEYFGGDLSSALVTSHLQRFAEDGRFANKFARFDITCMIPPRVDLIHARDVFMHIDTDLSLRAIRNFQRSGSKYLVVPHWPFFDGSSNEYHPADFELAYHNVHDLNPKASQVIGYHHYNLELPPYCFPAPLYWIRNSAIAERNGWLGVWALPALGRGQHSKCLARTAWFDTICDSRFNCFDTQEERRDCLAGNSRSGSPCCTALHLIQRLHSLDTGAMWFVEPQQVQSLCSDFVRLPTGSLLLEEQMTVCSRAVLALAEFAYETHTGNATHETRNESCSTVSVHARYPLLAEEDKVLSEQLQKQRLQWWDRAYRIHTHLGSSWSYQLNGRKLLMSLANHTAACDKLEQGCALFNPWEPQRCFPHHPLIRAWSPSCRKRPQIPRRPLRASPGPVRDWLGLRQDCGHSESEESSPVPQIRPHVSVTRALECAGLPWGPVAGEDYFETISFLSAVEDAPADTFNVIEVAGSLFWALKAAKAFKRRSSGGACKLIFFPTLPATSRELHHDGRRKLCNTTVYRSQINSGLLDSTLAAGHVDFLHADIFEEEQGQLILGSSFLQNVRHVFLKTHGHLHKILRAGLVERNFAISFDFVGKGFPRTLYGPIVFNGGVLAAKGRVGSSVGGAEGELMSHRCRKSETGDVRSCDGIGDSEADVGHDNEADGGYHGGGGGFPAVPRNFEPGWLMNMLYIETGAPTGLQITNYILIPSQDRFDLNPKPQPKRHSYALRVSTKGNPL
ncbi:unnamed protein product [Symbiodinium microadriaticum]|nr:unnamed protein product [Symbiodinium microadriaticum]